ncbi:MAG: hypothetical protein IJX78_02495 [Bacilli bacterium]|nr:hypothetical protein [Bacilli bacterium]
MNRFNVYLMKNKKAKYLIYLTFYVVIGTVGLALLVESCGKKDLLMISQSLSLLTFALGAFYFMGYDFLEHKSEILKRVCKITGFLLMLGLTVIHLIIDIKIEAISFEIFLLGCKPKFVWELGLACSSYIYFVVVRRLYRTTVENYVSEDKRLLIQLFLPLICFLAMSLFMRIGLAWLCFLVVAYIFMDASRHKRRRAK